MQGANMGAGAEGARGRQTLLGALKAELLKACSYPSLIVTALAIVAFSAVASAYLTYMAGARPDAAAGLTPSTAYQFALPIEQAGFALLGALVLYMDEERGMAPSLLAVPRRGRLLAAKLATSALWAAGTGALSVGVAYASRTTVLMLASGDVGASAEPLVRVEALVLWWTVLSVLVTGLATLVRRSMPILVLSLTMMLMLSSVLRGITSAAAWLPDQLALCLYQLTPPTGGMDARAAVAGLCAWAIASSMGAWLSIARWNPR